MYQRLLDIDVKLQRWVDSKPTGNVAIDEQSTNVSWPLDLISEVGTVQDFGDAATKLLKDSILERLRTLTTPVPLAVQQSESNVHDTGESDVTHTFVYALSEIDIGKYFTHHLEGGHPFVLVSVLLVVILNTLGHVARPMCNMALGFLRYSLTLAFNRGNKPTRHEDDIKNHFPRDIRTARQVFDIEPDVTIYACCPSCCFLYAPKNGQVPEYPAICDYRRHPNSSPCGTRLTKRGVVNHESIRVPKRPFAMNNFNEFIAGLLSRPGIEDTMDRMLRWREVDGMWDVGHGSALRDLPGPDGKPFLSSVGSELRLPWAISVDFFNPHHNKIAGKSVAAGSIVMTCLLLPPSIRYKPENVYLMGIIPGPKEPSLEELDQFFVPLVDTLLVSYRDGIFYNRTYAYDRGRRVRSAVPLSVHDLPAARKFSGQASHSARCFCSLCWLSQSAVNNIDRSSWIHRTRTETYNAAKNWRDAESLTQRKKLYKENGVRWCQWWRLPYWDPTTQVVVDGMHNLFLGLVQYHFRDLLGLDTYADRHHIERTPKIVAEIQKLRNILSSPLSESSTSKLKKFSAAALRIFCHEEGIEVKAHGRRKKATKKQVIASLIDVSHESLYSGRNI